METEKIIFKARPDMLQVIIPTSLDFSTIKGMLEEKLRTSSKFFEGFGSAISFSGRVLSEQEENELINIFLCEKSINVDFFDLGRGAIKSKKKLPEGEESSIFYKGAVRSGQMLQHEGSIVILGDVNAGAEVVSYGNIIVLGKLRGTAHAGASGNKEAYIAALALTPIQIRIAELITYLPPEPKSFWRDKKNLPHPSIAYIADNQIAISQL